MRNETGLLVKPIMFVSSYAPMFFILFIRFSGPLRWVCLGLAILGTIGVLLVLNLHEHKDVRQNLTTADPADDGAAGYLAGYLLPFLTIAQPVWTDLLGYVVFLLVAYLVSIRTAMIQVNPMLFLLGWKVYAVTDSGGFHGYILSREHLRAGLQIDAFPITNGIRLLHQICPPQNGPKP